MRSSGVLTPIRELSEEQNVTRNACLALLQKLGSDSRQARAWQQLLAHMLMQQLSEPDESSE